MKKQELIELLREVRALIISEGEESFSELKRKTKKEIHHLMASKIRFEHDGDSDGSYRMIDVGKLVNDDALLEEQIVFFSYAVAWSEFENGLYSLYFSSDQDNNTVSEIDKLIDDLSADVKVINLTPHAVTIVNDTGDVIATFPASGQTARVISTAITLPDVAGVPAVRTEYGEIEGLPDPTVGTIYLVSVVVAQALKNPRSDVYVPDTGPASVMRNESGQIIGVKRLMQF